MKVNPFKSKFLQEQTPFQTGLYSPPIKQTRSHNFFSFVKMAENIPNLLYCIIVLYYYCIIALCYYCICIVLYSYKMGFSSKTTQYFVYKTVPKRSGGGVVDNTLDYQSTDPMLLWSFGREFKPKSRLRMNVVGGTFNPSSVTHSLTYSTPKMQDSA